MYRPSAIRFARVAVAAAALAAATPAHADAIDGEWCLAGSHFKIEGPTIVTPGGNRIQGDYSRHGFRYIVPAGETGTGSEITMMLLDEEHVSVRNGAAESTVWRRCQVTS
jgi:hypothetical protein